MNVLIKIQVARLRERGTQFLQVPKSYYVDLKERLAHSKVRIQEDLETVKKQRNAESFSHFFYSKIFLLFCFDSDRKIEHSRRL